MKGLARKIESSIDGATEKIMTVNNPPMQAKLQFEKE
eukprot:CAMPEP_0116882326 /NCGR_PEP_ID=MMETSP0463-20121206/14529_1 /TAXON_ID=181622 /ORGANISM="Strombidinopsis sp, Strain SopsisLIS2011" /LENGTH=36 /DNA_ID= /DNA_START= /DNA_END= /DNA_ORIENTATION=